MSWRRGLAGQAKPSDGEFVPICLVDGVGRPKVLAIKREHISPTVIPFPHPQRGKNEAQVIVHFDRSNNEYDDFGRQVYRQRGSGLPPIRSWYLKPKESA